jgi:uncharacterized protein with PIN domain
VATLFLRAYGRLNDFLAPTRRQRTLVCTFDGRVSLKDLVEAAGVPHPEIDVVIADGEPVGFDHLVRDGERIAIYPAFSQLDLPDASRVGPLVQAEPRFVADAHLGRLAAYLRLLGFDTAYRNDYSDRELVEISSSEDRTLLTRDVGALKHRKVARGYYLRESQPARQLVEVLRRFDLALLASPFSRCLRCNTLLARVGKDRVEHLLPGRARERYDEFSRCPTCGRVYWKGSHYDRMQRLARAAIAAAAGGSGTASRVT